MADLNYGLLPEDEDDSPFGREPTIANDYDANQSMDSWFNFTRTSTFSEAVFGPEMTMRRGFTEALGLNYESEEAWTRTLVEAYAFGEHARRYLKETTLPKTVLYVF